MNFRIAQGWNSKREHFPTNFSLHRSGVSQPVFTSRENSADTITGLQQRILQRPREHGWLREFGDLCAQEGTGLEDCDAWFNFVFSLL